MGKTIEMDTAKKVRKPRAKKEQVKQAVETDNEETLLRQKMADTGMTDAQIEEAILEDKAKIEAYNALHEEVESKFHNELTFKPDGSVKLSPFVDEMIRRLTPLEKYKLPPNASDLVRQAFDFFKGKAFSRAYVKKNFLVHGDQMLKELDACVDIGYVAVEYIGQVKHYFFPGPVYMLQNMSRRAEYYHAMLRLAEVSKALLIESSVELEVFEAGYFLYQQKINEYHAKKKENGNSKEEVTE